MTNYDDEILMQTAFDSFTPTSPENDTFHSIYIAGKSRSNHIGVKERVGKLQVRGVEYNLDEVHGIILHTKSVMVNSKDNNMICFSFMTNNKGTSGRDCPQNRSVRLSNPFCSSCRQEILVSFIYTNENGDPITNDNEEPIFVFIRAKGIRYSSVNEYLNELVKIDSEQKVFPDDPVKERRLANLKRYVTRISVGERDSDKYGAFKVFELDRSKEVDIDQIRKLIEIQKGSLSLFIEKFDWSKKKQFLSSASDYLNDDEVNKAVNESENQNKPTQSTPKNKNTRALDIDLGDMPF